MTNLKKGPGLVPRMSKTDEVRKRNLIVLCSLLASIFTFPANAGDVLRLKSGEIRPVDVSQSLLNQTLSGSSDTGVALQDAQEFVVQFKEAIQPSDRDLLVAQGLIVFRYLPDDAYLVRGTGETFALLTSLTDRIRAVHPYLPTWKVSEELALSSDQAQPQSTGVLSDSSSARGLSIDRVEELSVSLVDGVAAAPLARTIRRLQGVSRVYLVGTDLLVRAKRSAVSEIAGLSGIEWIERAPLVTTYDYEMSEADRTLEDSSGGPSVSSYEYTGYESGNKIIGAETAWSQGYLGAGQISALADTGVDTGLPATMHPDLVGATKGYAFGLGASGWDDSMGHGTHVCGSVIGNGARTDGKIKGVAPQAQILVGGLWSPVMNGLVFGNDMAKVLNPPYQDGAKIHTNSWGADAKGAYDAMASKVDAFMWDHPDMLVIFAAGNSGQDLDANGHIDPGSIGSPATAKNVLSVGASENLLAKGGIQKTLGELRDGLKKWGAEPIKSDRLSDNPNGIAAFSSRGPTRDGRIKPEVVAPGTNIVSTRSKNPKASPLWGEFNADYVYSGGTSMATPMVAGAATVAREYLVRSKGVANPSAALLKAALMHTARDLFPGQYGATGGVTQELTRRPNVDEGYGRVDLEALMAMAGETRIEDETQGVAVGETKTYAVEVGAGGVLRATLAYTDAPGSTSASRTLVNDLDLSVTTPSGEVRDLRDRVNNSEMLELSGLAPGRYTVSVKGINVPSGKNGKQPFALLVTR